jgi:23S rRNA (uracil1939-C5)-methyltransferase
MLNLYAKALELANIQPTDIVLDCYSGIGTMSILFASKAKKVIAVENNPSSVQDAKYNQRLNKIQNIEFVLDDATNYMNKSTQKMDILVMDPPRSGSTPEFLDAVLKLKPRKVVYVSCDIETQVRDIKQLLSVYHIKEVIPIDMFSDTKHIELVTLLELK